MFVKVRTSGPDAYGHWSAEAKTAGATAIGSGPTEHDAIEDSRELMAIYFKVPFEEVMIEGGIKREDGD